MAVPYEAITFQAAARYGIPPSLLAAQQFVESGFRPGAVSSAGAFGVTQFMPGTARSYGVQRGSSPAAVRSQIMGQARYLIEAGYRKNPSRALGAYVGGPGNPDHPWYWNRVFAAQKRFRGMDARFAAQRGGGPAPAAAGAPAGAAPAGVAAPSFEMPERPPLPQIQVSAPALPSFVAGPPTAGAPAMLPSMPPQAPQGLRDAVGAVQAPGVPAPAPAAGRPGGGGSGGPVARMALRGGYSGTQGLVDGVATPIAKRLGFGAGSSKRTPAHNAEVGGAADSDHLTSNSRAFARDYPTMNGTRLAQQIARAYGVKFVPNSYSSGGTIRTPDGRRVRIQILWGAGIDHDDHVHVGARIVG